MARFTFCPPPGWPEPATDFLPAAGWQPDPTWPPAPAGWQFYRDSYGYPTPPPLELWQPWPAVDWAQRVGMDPDAPADGEPPADLAVTPATRRRRRRWLWPLVAVLVLALLGGGLAWAWSRLHPGIPQSHVVADVKPLYQPPLQVGSVQYQFGDTVKTSESFSGSGACIKQANAAVSPAKQAVVAGTSAGWGAMTWRFATADEASAAWKKLEGVLDGCTESTYKLSNPTHSPDAARQWVQYQQSAKDGTDHGRVVLTSDANTLTWIEGGRQDLGQTAWTALRKRLATLK